MSGALGFIGTIAVVAALIAWGYALGWLAAKSHVSSRVFGPWLNSLGMGGDYWLRAADYEAAWNNYRAIGDFPRPARWETTGSHTRDARLLALHASLEEDTDA